MTSKIMLTLIAMIVISLFCSAQSLNEENIRLRVALLGSVALNDSLNRLIDVLERIDEHDRQTDDELLHQIQKLRTLPKDSQDYILRQLPDDIRNILNGMSDDPGAVTGRDGEQVSDIIGAGEHVEM